MLVILLRVSTSRKTKGELSSVTVEAGAVLAFPVRLELAINPYLRLRFEPKR